MITNYFRFLLPLWLAAILLSHSGCSDETEKIVAEVDDELITLDEFKIGYLNIIKKPDVFDSKKLREQYLDELIRIKLISDEAYKMKLDTAERYRYRFEAYLNKALREEHYEQVIKPKINISEEDIEKTYQYTQEERRISHLFFKSEEEADSVYKLLQSGKEFDELAEEIFSEPTLQQSGGDLGWILWDQLDYNLAQTAFTLAVGEYSKPVKSSFGYHVVKVTDFKKRPMITRTEYEQRKSKTKYLLEYKIGDQIALDYIQDAAHSAEVDIKEDAFWFVHDKLAGKFTRQPTQFDQMFDLQLKEEEVRLLESSLWDERNRTIVTVNGNDYTIGQVIGALNYIPYGKLYAGFKGAMDLVIRDFILTQEAKEMGLENNPHVQTKVEMFKDYVLQLELRRKIVRETGVTDKEIEEYYEQNKHNYKGALYSEVYPVIKKILTGKKKREAVPVYADSLAKGKTIKKYLQVIHAYYDSVTGYN